jgi:hypothetical protein
MAGGFVKDPDAVLDYNFDWTPWLAGDTITSSSWVAESGITVDSDGFTATMTTVWLSGGAAGEKYEITNTIGTSNGRSEDRTFRIRVREK